MNVRKIIKQTRYNKDKKELFIKRITEAQLKFNKMTLAVRLGLEGLPECFTQSERQKQVDEGRMPDGWEFHHILPLFDGGTHSIDNGCYIRTENHRPLHIELDKVRPTNGKYTSEDFKYLKAGAEFHNGLTLTMC